MANLRISKQESHTGAFYFSTSIPSMAQNFHKIVEISVDNLLSYQSKYSKIWKV